MALEFSFVDKNKHLKKQLAANFETLLHTRSDCIHHQNLEDFYNFLITYTDILTKNVYETKYFIYKNLDNSIKNHKLVIPSWDKDLSVVIMQQENYDMKHQNMIDDGIRQGIYSPNVNTTLSDLKKFQDFLHWINLGVSVPAEKESMQINRVLSNKGDIIINTG